MTRELSLTSAWLTALMAGDCERALLSMNIELRLAGVDGLAAGALEVITRQMPV